MRPENSNSQPANHNPVEFDGIAINANGVPASSPGLRGTRYPGTSCPHMIQPHRGCVRVNTRTAPSDGTALRFAARAAQSQGRPHFIRPTLGWRMQRLWRISDMRSAVSSRALESERTGTLAALDGFLKGLGYLK